MTYCIHCKTPVRTSTRPGYGSVWVHTTGYRECRPTYASPHFTESRTA